LSTGDINEPRLAISVNVLYWNEILKEWSIKKKTFIKCEMYYRNKKKLTEKDQWRMGGGSGHLE
jgi:hypothetical protein